jgi:hypothetical protein
MWTYLQTPPQRAWRLRTAAVQIGTSSAAISDYARVSIYPIKVTNEPHQQTRSPAAIAVGTAVNIPTPATIAPTPAAEHIRFNPVACFVVIVSFSFASGKATLVPIDSSGPAYATHVSDTRWASRHREICHADAAEYSAIAWASVAGHT